MFPSEYRPRGWSIEKEVRALLKERGRADVTTQACKCWAKEFIQALVPGWYPGALLTVAQSQLVGRAFTKLLGRPEIKPPRQESQRKKKRDR